MKKIVAVFGAVCLAIGSVYAQVSASCDPAPSGLVGWWKGDGNGNDNVGADNATVPTGVAYTPGEVALGFNLNGNYDDTNRILVPDAPQLNFGPNKDFSVEAWIQPLSNPGNYTDLSGEVMTVVGKRYAPSFYTAWGYEMYLGNGRLCFQMIDSLNRGGNFYNLGVEPDLRDGEFHHVAVTVQRNSTTGLRFYVDGQLIATFDPTAVQGDLSSTSPLRIGNHPTPGVKAFYHGVIDEVSLYNRALSSNEIAAIYNAGSAGKCPAPPTILVQPTNQTVAVGGTATFRVSAYGTPPLFYQWSFNGTYIPGATNTSLTLTNVQPAQAGRYAVWVAISYGSIISSNAVLTVLGATSCDPAPSGLAAMWEAEGNANDIINGNNGSPVGALGYADGKVGRAFVFDGSASYITVPASPSLNIGIGSGITIEGWIKPSAANNPGGPIIEWDSSSMDGLQFWADGDGSLWANMQYNPANAYGLVTPAGVINTNSFQHVAVTYDKSSGTEIIYVNGSAVASKNVGNVTPQTTYPVNIGRRTGQPIGNGDTYGGLIDELSLYNRALSAGEIAAIYNTGSAGKCPVPLAAPVIISQPTNQTASVGGTATFRVTASGTPPLFYQWRFNGTNILGATNTLLTLSNVQPIQAGIYAVQVANGGGSTNSANAKLTVTTPSSCDPAPSGLVGWWKGEGNANDSAGTNNGSLSASGATYATGEVGQGFRFDGTNGYVQIPDSDALKPANVTCEAWVWLDPGLPSHNGGEQIVFKKNTWSAWFEGYSLLKITIDNGDGTYSDRFQFCISRGGNQVAINSQTIAQRGVWYHVAATYNGNQSKLYVNGVLEASTTAGFALDYDTTPIFIGTSGTWAPYLSMFGGIIDEVSIYSRALSSNEIAAIYNAGSAGKCFTPTPPVIMTQPTNQTVSVGGTATFRVSASGTPPLFYQWRFNGTNILGATNTLLTLSNVQPIQAGIYVVQVANAGGSTNSANAVLTVITPPSSVPVITGFSPASGMTGISVRISGTNFSPVAASDTVYFGAVRAVVSAASTTNLVVSLPAGATYAPITETVKGLTAYANAPFLPTFSSGGMFSSSSLGPQIILPAGRGPGQVVIADFDGDGKPDLAVNSGLDHTIYIYRNISTNGFLTTNSFASPVVLQLGTGSEWGMVAADVDGDGKPDLVFLDYNSNVVSVLQNLCTPGIIMTNSFGSRVNFAVGSNPEGVAVQDLDGDGKPEIVTANTGSGTISVLRNIGTTGIIATNSFAPAVNFAGPTSIRDVAIADLDGDGKPDVVTVNYVNGNNNVVSVFRNVSTLGNIAFASRIDFPGPSYSYKLAIGDMDGDGKLDVVFVSFVNGQSVSVYRNTSVPGSFTTNSFAPRVDFGLGGWGNGMTLGDLDGDGKPDVAAVTQISSQLSLFRNISTPGGFTSSSLAARLDFASGSNPYGVAIGDLDGDGRPDVVYANNGDNTLSVCQNITPSSGTPSCDPAPPGLVAWWQAEGNANDSIGTNNGLLQGGVGFASGKVGQAFLFNNTNADVRIPASSNLNVGAGNGFTLEAWINPSNVSQLLPLFEWNAGDGTTYWGVHFYSMAQLAGELYANIVDSGGGWHIINSAGGVVTSGVFQHVALTYDKASGIATIYHNGTVVVRQNVGSFTPQTTYSLNLGRRPGPEANYTYAGLMDEASIYNRALSSNEIAAIYNAGSGGKCPLPTNYVNGTVVSPQPTLASVKTGANLQLTWPISAGTFHVQSADTPLGPWADASYTVTTNGDSAIVTVTATNQQQYFRLVGQ